MVELLSVDSLSAFYGSIRALWDVTLKVESGEIVSIVGANGAGKSTLLRSIMGLVKIHSGSVKLRGADIGGRAPHEVVARGVSFVPEGRRLFTMMTVEENLGIAAPRKCNDLAYRLDGVYALFPQLIELKVSAAGNLSGGQQQMVAIGRALMSKPDLLILDEPTLGLSPVVSGRVLDALDELASRGTAVLLAEQNPERAMGISDRTYVFENGRAVLSGSSRELMDDPGVRGAYLGVPV